MTDDVKMKKLKDEKETKEIFPKYDVEGPQF